MKKFVFSFLVFAAFVALGTREVGAKSLVIVNSEKQPIWNVLGESSFEVKRSASSSNGQIALKSDNGKVYLNDSDVSGWQGDLIEIEERPKVKQLTVSSLEGLFVIEQEGVKAITSLPINIDPQKDRFSVSTSSGNIFILVAPLEALESAKRSRFLSEYSEIRIEEKEGDLVYKIAGEKILNVFNVFDYKIPLTVFVSPSNGELLSIEGSQIFKIFGFLFS